MGTRDGTHVGLADGDSKGNTEATLGASDGASLPGVGLADGDSKGNTEATLGASDGALLLGDIVVLGASLFEDGFKVGVTVETPGTMVEGDTDGNKEGVREG